MTVYSEEKNLNKHSKFQYPVVGSFLAILIVATDTDMFLVKAFFSGALVQPAIPLSTALCVMLVCWPTSRNKKSKGINKCL